MPEPCDVTGTASFRSVPLCHQASQAGVKAVRVNSKKVTQPMMPRWVNIADAVRVETTVERSVVATGTGVPCSLSVGVFSFG